MSTKPAKTSTKHPYLAVEHRVIDSPAYADLTFSARALLVQIARQLTKTNNGHLQATFSYMERFGFSVNTLSRATHELITHGFIYKTKSGGFHQGAAQFAVTWLSVTNTNGIFMQGFKLCAWRDWQPVEKKSRSPKVRAYSLKNGERTPPTHPKSEAVPYPKSEHIELVPIEGALSTHTGSIPQHEIVANPDDHADDFQRIREDGISADCWNDGECRQPVKKIRTTSPAVEQVRAQVLKQQAMRTA